MEAQILQRIILSLLCLFSLYANHFQGLISFAIVDTFTGNVQKVLLEEGEIQVDNQFIVKVSSIKADTENPDIAWIDMTIDHKALDNDEFVCVQEGRLSTEQIYRLPGSRYLIGFNILPIR